jgi:hypothetical protein
VPVFPPSFHLPYKPGLLSFRQHLPFFLLSPSFQARLPFFSTCSSSFLSPILQYKPTFFSFLTAPVVSPLFHFPSRPFLPSSVPPSSFLSPSFWQLLSFLNLPYRPIFLSSRQHLSLLLPFTFLPGPSSLLPGSSTFLFSFLRSSLQARLPTFPSSSHPPSLS